LDTVGGSLARPARTDDTTLTIAVWATEALKITAVLHPLPTLRNPATAGLGIARLLGWIAPATQGIEGLVYEDAPDPQPAIGDALVQVRAASFTPTELTWPSGPIEPGTTGRH
jgi:hypothetical protein